MAYDFHGHFEPFLGHVSPLYASHLDVYGLNASYNVVSQVFYFKTFNEIFQFSW